MNPKAVIVKGVPIDVAETAIRDALTGYGPIATVTLREQRDFCFVEYESEDAALAACLEKTVIIGDQMATVEARGERRRPRKFQNGGRGRPRRSRSGANNEKPTPENTSRSIYIASLSESTSELDIESVFSSFGTIMRIQFNTTMRGRRYAFVEFESSHVVAEVISKSPYSIKGENIEVQERRLPQKFRQRYIPTESENVAQEEEHVESRAAVSAKVPPKPEMSIYIKGFPADTSEEVIREKFSHYGPIQSIIMRVKHTEDEDTRTWSFVEYQNADSVSAALNETASGIDIGGQEVTIEARKSEPRLFRGYWRNGRGGGWRGGYRGRRRGPPQSKKEENAVI